MLREKIIKEIKRESKVRKCSDKVDRKCIKNLSECRE